MRQWVVAGSVALAAAACVSVLEDGTRAPTPAIVLKPAVPVDLPAKPTHADAVAFAWQAFVALNWPALAGERGVPDKSKMIGQPGDVVWHTWKASEEIFLSKGEAPPPWNQYGPLPPECKTAGASSEHLVLRRLSKAPSGSSNSIIGRAREAVGGTLTDQHRNLARFEIRMNRTIFEEIVNRTWYNVQGQDKYRGVGISFPSGVMEVKAAWREMTAADSPAVKSRFYRQNAWIYDGPRLRCYQAEVGLVGLHITQKTPSRPQWTWATFEQIDNVQEPSGGAGPYSFYNPNCPPNICPPNRSTEKKGEPTGVPTQVTRVIAIGQAAVSANPQWQQALRSAVLGSPFAYYQLVDIQWPQEPELPTGNPTPGLVANTTMETYVKESSCLHCHFTARTASGSLSSDFSFMLGEAHPIGGGSKR